MEASGAAASPLKEAQAEFIQGGVGTTVASASALGVPSQSRAVGVVVSHDRLRITVLLRRSQAALLLDDITRSRQVAVVFAQPSTHRTLQIKSTDAVLDPQPRIDVAVLARQADAFYRELAPFGYSAELVQAMLGYEASDLVAVTLTPQAIFSQTPGPRAGERVA